MKAIWGKGFLEEKNIHLLFDYTFIPELGDRLDLAASNLSRLFVDGALVGYGPARAAHDYSRLDTYLLSPWAGKTITLSVEVYSANVNTYYTVEEPPFFAAELYRKDHLLADAGDFIARHMTGRVQKSRRFSFQRTFSEIYRLDAAPQYPVIETESVSMNQILPRHVSYPTLAPLDGQLLETGRVTLKPEGDFYQDRAYNELDQVLYKGFYPEDLEDDAPKDAARFDYTADPVPFSGAMGKLTYKLLTFSDPMNCSLPGSSVHGILQARLLEWVAVPFSRRSSQPRNQTGVSCTAGEFLTSGAIREAQQEKPPQ